MRFLLVLWAILVLVSVGCGPIEARWEDQYIDWFSDHSSRVHQSFNNVCDTFETLDREDDESKIALQLELKNLALTASKAYNVTAPDRLKTVHDNWKSSCGYLLLASGELILWLWSEDDDKFEEAMNHIDESNSFHEKANDAFEEYVKNL